MNTPPMLLGRAGVIVTAHSPAIEENSTGPSGPVTVNESARSGLVVARLTNETPERRSCCADGPFHVMSMGAGGGAHTAGVAIDANDTFIVRSPESVSVATPVSSGLSGPGDPVGVGEGVGEGDDSSGGGGETLIPWPTPLVLHAAMSTTRRTPSSGVRRVVTIPRSVPHALRSARTYDRGMSTSAGARSPGVVPASIAAGITFVTVGFYIALIVSQGEAELAGVVVIAIYLAGLGACALVGAVRRGPDRVIPLGIASGGLVGAAIVSLFSIGLLLLVAGVFALVAWARAGVGASRRDQLLGGIGGVVAAFAFLAVALLF